MTKLLEYRIKMYLTISGLVTVIFGSLKSILLVSVTFIRQSHFIMLIKFSQSMTKYRHVVKVYFECKFHAKFMPLLFRGIIFGNQRKVFYHIIWSDLLTKQYLLKIYEFFNILNILSLSLTIFFGCGFWKR